MGENLYPYRESSLFSSPVRDQTILIEISGLQTVTNNDFDSIKNKLVSHLISNAWMVLHPVFTVPILLIRFNVCLHIGRTAGLYSIIVSMFEHNSLHRLPVQRTISHSVFSAM